MNSNKPKKEPIGVSTVMHVNKKFAIAVIVLFMTVIMIFNFGWAGVIVADAVVDLAINPIIKLIDPEAKEIDVMAVMNPPTSESEAAKVYAEFPSLDTDAIKGYFGAAFDKFPDESAEGDLARALFLWIDNDLFGAVESTVGEIAKTVETYPADIERWYNDHLPFRSIIYNANERADAAMESDYSKVQNYLALNLNKLQYAFNVLKDGIPTGNSPLSPGGSADLGVVETDRIDDFENMGGESDPEEGVTVTEESLETLPDETETETVPEFIPLDSNTEETVPTFEESEETSEETLPTFEESEETSEETVPEFVETDDSESEEGGEECEHVWSEKFVEVEPTCTEWGVSACRCELCGKVSNREYISKLAHVASDTVVVEKEATCTEFGVVGYKCQGCDLVLDREYIAKVAHVASDTVVVEKEATCTEYGIAGYKCQGCDAVLDREYTPKAAHVASDIVVVEKEATCTEYGIAGYKCQGCDAVIDRAYTAKAAHIASDIVVVEKEATCTENGISGYRCQNCDAVTGRVYTAKAPHDYKTEVINANPLCGMNSKEISTCQNCGSTEEKYYPKKHTQGSIIKTVEASYTTYGYTLVSCADCGGQYRIDVSKSKPIDTSFALPMIKGEKRVVMEGRFKWLFYTGDNSESYFCGTNLMTDQEMADSLAVLMELDALCREQGKTLQICIWPNKDQVYPEYVTWTPVTNEKRVDRFVKYVNANSDVKIIYPLQELKSMKPYYEMYLQYDTHWNCAGGFVGYQAMLKSLGLETTDIRNCPVFEYTGVETENIDPYYKNTGGDMISLGQLSPSIYNGGFNYYVKYRPNITTDTFTGANGASDTRHTTASNATFDLNFVMFADSYRVMQLGYLEKDFSDCFLSHRSHVNDADSKEAIKNADIIVIAAVERYDSDIINTAKKIIQTLSEE